jgi:DnaK suppressor protein
MNGKRLEFFRQIIMEQLAAYISDPTHRGKLCGRIDKPVEIYEQASEDFEMEMHVALSNRSYYFVRQLGDALERIRDGSYGICLQCEDEIPEKRLMVRPSAGLCVHCQETNERFYHHRKSA